MSDMEDAGVLVMNFSDDEENFPVPMFIKPDEDFINSSANPNHINETFDQTQSIKLEGHSICLEESIENIFKVFDAPVQEEEYILGTDATPEILAIAGNTGIENNDSTEVQTQPDSVTITLDSDSDDDSVTSNSNPIIPPQNVDNCNKTYNNLNESKFAPDFSSIIISNIESVVDGSENISSRQVEESAAGEENSKSYELNSVQTNELQLGLPSRDISCPKQLFKCQLCDFSSKTRFSLSIHKRCHIDVDDIIQGKEESTSENNIVSQSDVCSLGTSVNSNVKSRNKNNSLCQLNDSIDASIKSNGESTSKVPQLNICPVNTTHERNEDSRANVSSVPASVNIPKTSLFKCKVCSFSSKIRFALQRHISSNHVDTLKKPEPTGDQIKRGHKCTTCLFIAKSTLGLANHIRILHNKTKVECRKVLKSKFMRQHKLTCNKEHRKPGRPRSTATVIAKERETQLRRPPSTVIAIAKERKAQLGRPASSQLKRPASTATGIAKKRKTSDVALTKKNNLEKKAIEKCHNTAVNVQSSTAPRYQCQYCSYTSNFDMTRHEHLHTKYNRPIYRCKECNYKSTKHALKRHTSVHKTLKTIPIQKNVKIGGLVRTKSGDNAKEGQDTNSAVKINCLPGASQSDTLVKHLDPTAKTTCKEILETWSAKGIDKQDTQAIAKSMLHETSKKICKNPPRSTFKRSIFQCFRCSHISKNQANFNTHRLMHTKSKEPLYSCKECNYVSTKAGLTRHMKYAHNKKVNNNIRVLKQVKLTQYNIDKKRESEHLVNSATTAEISVNERGSTLTGSISEIKLKDLKEYTPQLSSKKRHTVGDLESSYVLYVCEICAYETNNKESLIVHKLTHACTTDAKTSRLELKYETNAVPLTNNILTIPKEDNSKNITEAEERKRQCVLLKNNNTQCSVCTRMFVNRAAFAKHRCENLSVFFKLVKREGTKFTCKECLFSSDSWLRVKHHLLVHKTDEEAAVYKCLICDFRTKYKNNLGKHMGTIHDEKPSQENYKYNCDICNYKTNFHRSIGKHKISCHKEPIICDICGYKTLLPTVMANHKMSAHRLEEKEKADKGSDENIKYKCDSCDFQTSYKHNLQNHKILHININELRVYKNKTFNIKINEKKRGRSSYEEETNNDDTKLDAAKSSPPPNTPAALFSCSLCSYSSHKKSCLGLHMYHCKMKHPGKILKCNICDFTTLNLNYLTEHKYTHDASTLYHCSYCTYSTPAKKSLYMHRYLKHRKEKKTDNCAGEPENLTKSTKMKSSIQFSCKYCAYTTKFRFNLKKHIEKLHNKNKKIMENVVLSEDRKVINNSNKTFKKKFRCTFCSFSTNHKESFLRHVRFQHDENADSKVTMFKCSACSYTSRHKCNVKRHFKIHFKNNEDVNLAVIAIPTLNCNSCPYTTKLKSKLNIHLKTHITEIEGGEYPVKPARRVKPIHKCSSCFYTSKYKFNLDKHFNACHVQK